MSALLPENIPAELKVIPQWVLWRLEERNERPTKTPYQVNGRMAKVNDPSTWIDFDSALATYQAGGYDGLGIVLTKENRIVGTDLDKCLNPETGELEADAAQIASALPTYCEISPSGRGLRLFGFGTLPQGGRRKGKVELYTDGRYLTVTGNRFNGHDSLADITTEIAAVHARIFATSKPTSTVESAARSKATTANFAAPLTDDEVLDKARKAKNGTLFERLWAGDTSGHGGDASAADMALCNLLAFWTGGSAEQMDRLFRRSGLMRDKWNETHHADGRTYGQGTIEEAISATATVYTGRGDTAKKKRKKQLGVDLQTVTARTAWMNGYVFLTTDDVYMERLTGSVFSHRAWKLEAERAVPNGWEDGSPSTIFSREQHIHARYDCYRPGQDDIITDTDSVEGASIILFNTYRRPALPTPQEDFEKAEFFINHLRYLCGNDDKFLSLWLDWMATLIQRPSQRVRWMPLIISPAKGTGKSLVASVLTALLGKNNVGQLSNQSIGGTFHDALIGKQLLIVEEIRMFEDQQARLNEFKTWLTDDRVDCNRKGQKARTMDNVANFIGFSNYENAASIDRDERRYMVAVNHALPLDEAHYTRFAKTFLPAYGGDVSSILHLLMNRDLSNFNPCAPAISTEGREHMVTLNLNALQQTLAGMLERQEGILASELITWNELREVVGTAYENSTSGKELFPSNPVIDRARKAVGIESLGVKRAFEDGKQARIYSTRNHARWKNATAEEMRAYLTNRQQRKT